jgi:hypothetical protein
MALTAQRAKTATIPAGAALHRMVSKVIGLPRNFTTKVAPPARIGRMNGRQQSAQAAMSARPVKIGFFIENISINTFGMTPDLFCAT